MSGHYSNMPCLHEACTRVVRAFHTTLQCIPQTCMSGVFVMRVYVGWAQLYTLHTHTCTKDLLPTPNIEMI